MRGIYELVTFVLIVAFSRPVEAQVSSLQIIQTYCAKDGICVDMVEEPGRYRRLSRIFKVNQFGEVMQSTHRYKDIPQILRSRSISKELRKVDKQFKRHKLEN